MSLFETRPIFLVVLDRFPKQSLFLQDFLGLVPIIPKIRFRSMLNQLVDPFLFAVDVKDASAEGRAFLRVLRVVRVHLQT